MTATGIYPDDRKVEAIKNMPFPENKKELQRFLGMINYLGKFIPNFSENTENFKKLLEKDTEWYFDENHKKEIDKLKLLVISPSVLKFYNPVLPIKVSCDASENSLGAVLEQKENERWHPIAYASRTLNKSLSKTIAN